MSKVSILDTNVPALVESLINSADHPELATIRLWMSRHVGKINAKLYPRPAKCGRCGNCKLCKQAAANQRHEARKAEGLERLKPGRRMKCATLDKPEGCELPGCAACKFKKWKQRKKEKANVS
jgi:hypothetical protein